MGLEQFGIRKEYGRSPEDGAEALTEQARSALLSDGSSVRTALYEAPDGMVTNSDDAHEAFEALCIEHPDQVLACAGKSEAEAAAILKPLIHGSH